MVDFDPWATPQPTATTPPIIGRGPFIAILILASAALLIAAYLAIMSLLASGPAGCGAGSGCGQVLASKWSRVLAIPVSSLAACVYFAMLIAASCAVSTSPRLQRPAASLLALLAAAVASSALWFIWLQFAVIHEICPYCMADHLCGLLASSLILHQLFFRTSNPSRASRIFLAIPCAIGILLTIALATAQLFSHEHIQLIPPTGTTHDQILGQGPDRTIIALSGNLHLSLHDEPILGSPDGPTLIIMLFDYACPHCRHTHAVITQAQQDGLPITAVILPTPVYPTCNPFITEPIERFEHSCELARIVLAVWLADPRQFPDMDQWMFEPSTPRTPDQARAKATQLVGSSPFQHALADPRIDEILHRNVLAFGSSGADRVPVTVFPGHTTLVGPIENFPALRKLLESKSLHP